MKVLIVPAVAVREGEFVYPGEIQVVGYRGHVEEMCRLDELLECARGDLKQAMKISAYDEAKERDLFEEWASSVNLSLDKMHTNLPFLFKDPNVNCLWSGWKACAKSRAGIQS